VHRGKKEKELKEILYAGHQWLMAQGVGPKFKPLYCKKKKNQKPKNCM
jgi:hypothetical protein